MIVATGTLELHPEERLCDVLDRIFGSVAILDEVHRAALGGRPFSFENIACPLVVGDVLLEARSKQRLESFTAIGVEPGRVTAEQDHIPNVVFFFKQKTAYEI